MQVRLFPPVTPGLRPAALTGTSLNDLRRVHVQATWQSQNVAIRLVHLAMLPLWPLVALASILAWQLPRHALRARRDGGRSLILQALDQLRLALTANMWPHHYYMFELFRPARRRDAHAYLLRQETKHGIFSILKDGPRKNPAFARKDLFVEACHAAGLPHAGMIARLSGGSVAWSNGHAALPPIDLFVKPVMGRGGRGADRWRWRDGVYEGAGGRRESAASLLTHLQQRARRQELVVAPCLTNHAELAPLAQGALSTLRMVTVRNEAGDPELLAAALRFPRRAGALVDNFHAGGLAAIVDLARGCLGPATDLGLARDSAWHSRHPVNDARIEGLAVPFWREARALAVEAHAKLGDRVIIGWDIAVLPEGPALVEANGFPDLDLLQRCGAAPLGGSRLCDLLAHHLRRRYPAWRQRRGLSASGH
jgi:hypothetical protein